MRTTIKTTIVLSILLIAISLIAFAYKPEYADMLIQKEIVVKADIKDVWACWATSDGMATFFTDKSNI